MESGKKDGKETQHRFYNYLGVYKLTIETLYAIINKPVKQHLEGFHCKAHGQQMSSL